MAPARAPTDAPSSRPPGGSGVGLPVGVAACRGGVVHAAGSLATPFPDPARQRPLPGGVVSYSDAVKHEVLGVDAERLSRSGAVSARWPRPWPPAHSPDSPWRPGPRGHRHSRPDGGSAEKPIGLTYVAAARSDGRAIVERHVWPPRRDGNKRASALQRSSWRIARAED